MNKTTTAQTRVEALTKKATPKEKELVRMLKKLKVLYYFQFPIVREKFFYIADVLLPAYNLIIEMDGTHHYKGGRMRKDMIRDSLILQHLGYKTVRIENSKLTLNKVKKLLREHELK